MKPYCIENKAKGKFGTTECFELAGYILPNGEMLNFSYDGIMRTEDHRAIGWFFSKASGTQALLKFMRRGNVRVLCNRDTYCFEYIGKLTREQEIVIRSAERDAQGTGRWFVLEKDDKRGNATKTFFEMSEYYLSA